MPVGRDLRMMARLRPRAWADVARAALELGRARVRIGSAAPRDLVSRQGNDPAHPPPLSPEQSELVERVAFAIPRVASRLPWRADCLVQALAAQRWLGGHGIASKLTIGVRTSASSPFEAHAWLEVGARIVTGGDVSGFAPLPNQA